MPDGETQVKETDWSASSVQTRSGLPPALPIRSQGDIRATSNLRSTPALGGNICHLSIIKILIREVLDSPLT